MVNVYHQGKPVTSEEIQRILGNEYSVTSSDAQAVMGYINVKKISCRLYTSPSLESGCICFLTKDGRYGVVNKIGNYVELEGGGFVYLDGVSAEYTAN